jgi:hypothetical protein
MGTAMKFAERRRIAKISRQDSFDEVKCGAEEGMERKPPGGKVQHPEVLHESDEIEIQTHRQRDVPALKSPITLAHQRDEANDILKKQFILQTSLLKNKLRSFSTLARAQAVLQESDEYNGQIAASGVAISSKPSANKVLMQEGSLFVPKMLSSLRLPAFDYVQIYVWWLQDRQRRTDRIMSCVIIFGNPNRPRSLFSSLCTCARRICT